MMLKDKRQKGKIVYKIWDIVVVVILAVLADCSEWEEIEDYAKEEKAFLKKFLKLTGGIPSAKTWFFTIKYKKLAPFSSILL